MTNDTTLQWTVPYVHQKSAKSKKNDNEKSWTTGTCLLLKNEWKASAIAILHNTIDHKSYFRHKLEDIPIFCRFCTLLQTDTTPQEDITWLSEEFIIWQFASADVISNHCCNLRGELIIRQITALILSQNSQIIISHQKKWLTSQKQNFKIKSLFKNIEHGFGFHMHAY